MNPHKINEVRVKLKSLADESKTIRQEELKVLKGLEGLTEEDPKFWDIYRKFESLYFHRKGIVREEARLANLTYAFIRGRTRQSVESSHNPEKYYQCAGRFHGIEFETLHRKIVGFSSRMGVYKKPSKEQVEQWLVNGNVFYDYEEGNLKNA